MNNDYETIPTHFPDAVTYLQNVKPQKNRPTSQMGGKPLIKDVETSISTMFMKIVKTFTPPVPCSI